MLTHSPPRKAVTRSKPNTRISCTSSSSISGSSGPVLRSSRCASRIRSSTSTPSGSFSSSRSDLPFAHETFDAMRQDLIGLGAARKWGEVDGLADPFDEGRNGHAPRCDAGA